MSKKYHVERREFLNEIMDMRGHIIAIVEDTREIPQDDTDAWKWSEIKLMLGDCERNVSFEFCLCDAEERSNSLRKIRLISEIVEAFKTALEIEAEAIEERQAFVPLTKAAGTVH